MAQIPYHKLLEKIPNKYLLSVMLARRVKHICDSPEHSKELRESDAFSIAIREILEGKVELETVENYEELEAQASKE